MCSLYLQRQDILRGKQNILKIYKEEIFCDGWSVNAWPHGTYISVPRQLYILNLGSKLEKDKNHVHGRHANVLQTGVDNLIDHLVTVLPL